MNKYWCHFRRCHNEQNSSSNETCPIQNSANLNPTMSSAVDQSPHVDNRNSLLRCPHAGFGPCDVTCTQLTICKLTKKVRRDDLAEVGVGDVYVETLRRVDKDTTVGGRADELLLRDFPHRLADGLDLVGTLRFCTVAAMDSFFKS